MHAVPMQTLLIHEDKQGLCRQAATDLIVKQKLVYDTSITRRDNQIKLHTKR